MCALVQVPSTLSSSYLPLEFAQMERTKCTPRNVTAALRMIQLSYGFLTFCHHRYSCPDRLNGKRANSSTDIWSLGMSLLEMHLGHYVYAPAHCVWR